MSYLTDTHSHLFWNQFDDDLPEVINNARNNNVQRILCLGTDYRNSLQCLQIAESYPEVYAAAGIHPTDVYHGESGDHDKIKTLADSEEKIVAIGEIGLDLYWKDVPLKDQLPVFEKMLCFSEELNLPVVIHNRDAQAEMQDFFKNSGINKLNGVMHSFAGTREDADFYLEMGLHISFTGVITFKKYKDIDVVRHVPLERLLLETDAPFLAPVPKRGRRNEPAFVAHTAQKIADVHDTDYTEICRLTAENANRLFKWA